MRHSWFCIIFNFMVIALAISHVTAQEQPKVLSRPEALQLPDLEKLKARIERFYEGEKVKSGKVFFELIHPSLRGGKTIDQAPEVFPWEYDLLSWKIISIEPMPFPEKPEAPVTAAARVAMDVTIRTKAGETEKPADQTDYWVYSNGDWYWTWRGWPAD